MSSQRCSTVTETRDIAMSIILTVVSLYRMSIENGHVVLMLTVEQDTETLSINVNSWTKWKKNTFLLQLNNLRFARIYSLICSQAKMAITNCQKIMHSFESDGIIPFVWAEYWRTNTSLLPAVYISYSNTKFPAYPCRKVGGEPSTLSTIAVNKIEPSLDNSIY